MGQSRRWKGRKVRNHHQIQGGRKQAGHHCDLEKLVELKSTLINARRSSARQMVERKCLDLISRTFPMWDGGVGGFYVQGKDEQIRPENWKLHHELRALRICKILIDEHHAETDNDKLSAKMFSEVL